MKTLTDRSIQSLKPRDIRYDVRDAALPGLSIRVNANGTKTWTVKVSRDGNQQRVTLGKYPDVRLAEARIKAAERKESGIRVSGTVTDVFSKYLDEIKLSKRSWRDVEQVARLYMLPFIGNKKIDMVTALDGVALIDLVTKRSSRNRAAMTLAYLRPFFRWAAGKSIIPTNPWAVLVAPQNTTQARERVLTDTELASIWEFSKKAPYPFGPFLQVLILSGQRRAEVAGMEWFELDEARQLWAIPITRHKQKRGHEVPLPSAAWAVIGNITRHSSFLFSTTRVTPISGFGRFKERIDKETGVSNWRLHDIRRTAATRMAEMNIPQFTIARVLGHSDTSITAVYNRASYRDEKRDALEKWAKFVADLEGK